MQHRRRHRPGLSSSLPSWSLPKSLPAGVDLLMSSFGMSLLSVVVFATRVLHIFKEWSFQNLSTLTSFEVACVCAHHARMMTDIPCFFYSSFLVTSVDAQRTTEEKQDELMVRCANKRNYKWMHRPGLCRFLLCIQVYVSHSNHCHARLDEKEKFYTIEERVICEPVSSRKIPMQSFFFLICSNCDI